MRKTTVVLTAEGFVRFAFERNECLDAFAAAMEHLEGEESLDLACRLASVLGGEQDTSLDAQWECANMTREAEAEARANSY
jgi:hypothetical protein